MFKCMEIAEKVYKRGTSSKSTIRADSNRASHVRKRKGGEPAYPTNPEKGRAGKRKKTHAGHPSDRRTGDKICSVHGFWPSTEDCEVLKKYSKNYAMQQSHKDKEYRSNKRVR